MVLWRIADDETTQTLCDGAWVAADVGPRQGTVLLESECFALRQHDMAAADADRSLAYCERCGWSVDVEPVDDQ